jgi:hypothetical protein
MKNAHKLIKAAQSYIIDFIVRHGIIAKLLSRIKMSGSGRYWESLNRFDWVTSKIKELNLENSRILDVGGATGDNILRSQFGYNVDTLDVLPNADIVCSATEIPLGSDSYDLVTCIDMLEHVPKEIRQRIIDEMIRVAKFAVLIVAPQDSSANRLAEDLVLSYTKSMFVRQHKEHGLLNTEETLKLLNIYLEQGRISSFQMDQIDDLRTWVMCMTAGYVNVSDIFEKTQDFAFCNSLKRACFLIVK